MTTPTFVHANCLDYLPILPEASVDFTLTSPPYDAIRDYKGFPPIDRVRLGKALYRVAKPGSICAVVIQDQTRNGAKSLTSFRWAVDWADECGWRLFETCLYQREGVPGNHWRTRFRVDHEYVHLFLKGDRPAYFDKSRLTVPCKTAGKVLQHGQRRKPDGSVERVAKEITIAPTKCRGTVWKYSKSCTEGNRLKLAHPATFPGRLASDLIRCFCPVGGLVLDPFCGSGTTCIEAAKLGRNAVGIEIADEYVSLCRKRAETEIEADCFD